MCSVQCPELSFHDQSLGHEETEALVRAMETRVERVLLGHVTLNIEALTKYSGRGKCRRFWFENAAKYREELRSWASNKGWEVIQDNGINFVMKRN